MKLYLVAGQGGSARVAILDGSNHTRKQRFVVYEELKKLGSVEIIFVEVIEKCERESERTNGALLLELLLLFRGFESRLLD
jgi:hypothetical protein